MRKLLLLLIMSFSVSTINAQSPCEGFISNILALGYDQSPTVFFIANTNLPSGWSILNSTFELKFRDGTTIKRDGDFNSQGDPILAIDVFCNNKVMEAEVSVRFMKSNGLFIQLCEDIKTKDWIPFGVCGTYAPYKVIPNPAKDVLNIQTSGNINNSSNVEVIIYNLNGIVEQKQVLRSFQTAQLNVSDLKPGNYILKIISDDKVIESKNIIISY